MITDLWPLWLATGLALATAIVLMVYIWDNW